MENNKNNKDVTQVLESYQVCIVLNFHLSFLTPLQRHKKEVTYTGLLLSFLFYKLKACLPFPSFTMCLQLEPCSPLSSCCPLFLTCACDPGRICALSQVSRQAIFTRASRIGNNNEGCCPTWSKGISLWFVLYVCALWNYFIDMSNLLPYFFACKIVFIKITQTAWPSSCCMQIGYLQRVSYCFKSLLSFHRWSNKKYRKIKRK